MSFIHESPDWRDLLRIVAERLFSNWWPAAFLLDGKRRLRVPEALVLHYGAAEPEDWAGPGPLSSPARTVRDCIADGLEPDLVSQAIEEGLQRGLFTGAEVCS